MKKSWVMVGVTDVLQAWKLAVVPQPKSHRKSNPHNITEGQILSV